ncbi:MAG: GGDEF domain-containing protein, partial [candidate division Zixibacteria bacterium]|nr:GGDEF domain-containing protein [candidate division Zixibacteria bacterium]
VSRPSSILKLVRHRDSETIIPEIVNSIKTDLRMDKIVYIYEQDGDATTPLLVTDGVDDSLEVPSESAFEKLRRVLVDGEPRKVNDFSVEYEPLQNWSRDLKRAGLKHLMSFSVSPLRQGIIAWSGGGSVRLVGDRLGLLKNHAGDLVENTLTHERTKEMSYTDNLTGLSNQRFFLKRLEEETARAVRYGRRIALIFFDLDDLKSINDTNGHLAGDAVLRQLGSIFHNSIRSIDVVARYGGDEFCIIMPEADGTICRKFMKRLLSAISRAEFRIDEHDNFSSCTVSAGGAVFPDDGADSMKLIHAADMALLGAKSRGGNKALLYGEYE